MVSKKGVVAIVLVVAGLLLVLALVPRGMLTGASAMNVPTTNVLLHEDAEESNYSIWDARWIRSDANPASGDDHWCRTMHDYHDGNHSIYCARIGANSHYMIPIRMADGSTGYVQPWNVNVTGLPATTPQTQWVMRYDTDQDALMRRAVPNAQYYANLSLTFWFWSHTGSSDAKQPGTNASVGYDFLNAVYYTGSGNSVTKHVLWTDNYQEATAQRWLQVKVSVPNNATMVGFEFVSGTKAPQGGDATNAFASSGVRMQKGGMLEGAYLDGIYVNGSDPSPNLPLTTSVEELPSFLNSTGFPIDVVADRPSDLSHVSLYYRTSGESAWTKYTTSSNRDGKFSSTPIMFIAPSNGTYEFMTQGVDLNGVAEPLHNKADAWTTVGPPVQETSSNTGGSSSNK
ncbi:MAG: hypothetical protein SA339_06650 [Methanomassiliicoccus sp.]|nr:hypothetical protein [Methanomassiliicoccus sp.]